MNLKRGCLIVLLGAMSASGLRAATISWTNTSGGLWSAPLNWDAHFVPRSFDTALITAAGTYTVTLDIDTTNASLTLGGASGSQTVTNNIHALTLGSALVAANGIFNLHGGVVNGSGLTNQGTFNWTGGTLDLPTIVAAAGTLNVNSGAVALESPLTNLGTVHCSSNSSSITIYNNHGIYTGVIYNQAGALFDNQNDATIYSAGYGFESFVNAGTFRKSAGAGTTSINVLFTNAGTGLVDAQSGTIQFAAGGNIGGAYNTAAGATIQFTAGSFFEIGSVTNTGSGLFRQYGANVMLNDRITKFLLINGNVALSPTFQGSGAIQNLQLDGAYLTGTNRVTGTLGFNGGGTASASPLTVTASGILNFNGAAVNIEAPLTNAGTINWSGGGISVYNNAGIYTGAIYNQSGGLFNLQNDQTLSPAGYGLEFIINAGTIRKTAGLGVSGFTLFVTNNGTVDAQSGTVQFSGGGNIGGTYNTASGTAIQFSGGNFFHTGSATVTGSGLCRLMTGAAATLNDKIVGFVLAGGNVALSPTFQTNGAIHNLQLNGAYLTGTNRVTGTLGFDGGGVAASSPLTILTNGVLNFNGAAVSIYAPVTNAGTINWSSGGVTMYYNAANYTGIIYNQPGALFNIQCDQSLGPAGYGIEFISNAGTIRKTAGLGTSAFSLFVTNTGMVDAQSGTIQFSGGGNIGGVYNTASGATIQFTGGNFFETGAVTVTGAGLCRLFNSATVTLNDKIVGFVLASGNVVLSPGFQTDGTIHDLQLDGANLTGANKVTGVLGFNGGGLPSSSSPLTVAPGGVLNFNGASVAFYAPLTNYGTINWTDGGVSVNNNAAAYTGAIYNQSGGLFNIKCDQGLSSGGYGFELFSNAGTYRKTAGLGTTSCNVPFANGGTLDAQSGIIGFSGPYTQTGGTMNFGITSLSYFGRITFNAVAPFTGTLSANFNGSYFPSAGDSFPLVTYASRSGVFANLALPSQAQWQTNYSGTTLTLTVLSVSGSPPVTLTPVSLAGGNFTLKINGSVGPQYILQASSNLVNWTGIYTNTPSVMPLTVIDNNAAAFKRRFYRAQIGP